jgi:hypothetical protein
MLDIRCDVLLWLKWKICPKQNLRDRRKRAQAIECRLIGRHRKIVEEILEFRQHFFRTLRHGLHDGHRREQGDAMGNRWQHAARVRKNEFQVRATLQRVRKNEIDDRAGRVTRKFEQRRRTSQSNCLEASRRGRVQKDCRVTRIERIEDRRKRGIPKIFAVSVRLDDDATRPSAVRGPIATAWLRRA